MVKWPMIRTAPIIKTLRMLPIQKKLNLLRLILAELGIGQTAIKLEVAHFIKLLGKCENPVILDVGANSGEWSKEFLLLKPKSTIHIFEPSESHYESLIEFASTKYNQIIVHQIGLSGDGRECLLYSPNPGSGAASIYNKENLGNRYRETIQTNTLSNVLSELPSSVGCKLDIERAELDVLTSARDVLKNSNIRVLEFEFGENTTLLRQSFRDFFNFFESINFELFRSAPTGLYPISEYSRFDEIHVNTVYFARRRND